ncbi:hypothetical protein [Thalassospira xiamenensis]|uniref:Uncharacterized protein n=1 Tax=Thalassospira xiamenensis TaxID=220697 RepID=A0A285TRI0_9PROT|nr:hypothetical protein [Thalassospira xiamenensis]SOC26046.1 hypothetical protein SAMN05428964_10536 [Thalassospira xiamenensis]
MNIFKQGRLLGLGVILSAIIMFGFTAPSSAEACGKLGQPACVTCVDKVTVYFPFNFCCIPEASSCRKTAYTCNAGYVRDGMGICTKTSLTAEEAVKAGCRTSRSAQLILDDAKKTGDLGTITSSQVSAFRPTDKWMTTLEVTDPNTWGYRATDFPDEIKSLEGGKTLSKAERREKKVTDKSAFWRQNGPKIDYGTKSSILNSFQMIATSDSSKPMSQFSSVALDYEVASGFGGTVYKFQMNPSSPVLGLRDCSLSGGGETQFQVKGGTPIKNLHRFVNSKNKWEIYKNGKWQIVAAPNDEL